MNIWQSLFILAFVIFELCQCSDKKFHGYKIPSTSDELFTYLQAAMSLEVSTLPLYLTQYLSLKTDHNGNYRSREAAKVADKLFGICMDEMLHIALVSNMVSSIYGDNNIDVCYNIRYGPHASLPAEIMTDIDDLSLRPYSKDALWTAIQIEAPAMLMHDNKFDKKTKRSAFEPKPGKNSVKLDFHKQDHYNQIGEFYEAIAIGIETLAADGQISFAHDEYHKQRQCQAVPNRPITQYPITSVQRAKRAIALIQEQGEGYDLHSQQFAAVVDQDNKDISDDIENMDENNTDKSHFIQFVELMVGKKVIEFNLLKDDEKRLKYEFVYEDGYSLRLHEDEYYSKKEIEHNSGRRGDVCNLNQNYEDLLKELTNGLQQGEVSGAAIGTMNDLKVTFVECVNNGILPTWKVNCGPPPVIE